MISLQDSCRCGGRVIHMTEEYACGRCGIVVPKDPSNETYQGPKVGYRPFQFTSKALGTDTFVPPEDQPEIACTSLIERICDRQQLPDIAKGEAVKTAKTLIESTKDITLPCIAAYSVIDACRTMGITRVAQKNVMKSLTNLGYRVRPKDMLKLQAESTPRTWIAEDHVNGVVARIASLKPVQERPLRAQAYLVLSGLPMIERGSHNPRGLAATAVYCAEVMLAKESHTHKRFSQKDIASVADVEEYTVREAYAQFFKGLTVGHLDTFCAVDTTI